MDVRDDRTTGPVQAWLAAIVESSDDAIIGKDLNRIITSWNKGAERMYGYTAEEAIGRPVSILLPPNQRDETVDIVERIKHGERVDHYETRRMRKDGTILNVSLTVSPVYDAGGRVIGASKIARDITEHKQAEQRTIQLHAIASALSEARTVEQVADVILRQGLSAIGVTAGSIVLVTENDTMLEVAYATAYPQEVLEHWRRFPVDTVVPLADAVRTGQPVWLPTSAAMHTAYPGLASSDLGHRAWAALPLVVSARPIGALGLSFSEPQALARQDRKFMLTLSGLCAQALDRARLYDAERSARADAELATQAKNRFLANLSHDLRTPLNSIMGMAQVLLLQAIGPLNERQAEAANDILTGGQYLQSLLNHALDLSRNEDGQLRLQLSEVDLSRLIHNSVVLVRQEALVRKIAVETEIDDNLPIIHADEHRIMQVLANLLSNAVKFTPDAGHVGIRASCQADRLRLEVWDTGIGIAPENQPLLFQPFERLEHIRAMGRFEGTGLGLALSKQLINLHGGQIGVTSDGEGRGATFWFTLPVDNKT